MSRQTYTKSYNWNYEVYSVLNRHVCAGWRVHGLVHDGVFIMGSRILPKYPYTCMCLFMHLCWLEILSFMHVWYNILNNLMHTIMYALCMNKQLKSLCVFIELLYV